jgi:hypothetical protein
MKEYNEDLKFVNLQNLTRPLDLKKPDSLSHKLETCCETPETNESE